MRITIINLLCILVGCMAYGQTAEMAQRKAFRQQLDNPATREQTLLEGLKSPDAAIRKKALFEIYQERGNGAAETIRQMVSDGDKGVQLLIIACIRNIQDATLRTDLANYVIAHATADELKRDARRLVSSFSLNRVNVRLKDNPTFDHEVTVGEKIELRDEGWLCIKDVQENGHELGYYKRELDERNWKPIRLGAWESQWVGPYDGIAWYRIRFQAPPKAKGTIGAELHFKGVDEVAWLWLNETYVGQHDLGPSGWDVPFTMDITEEIKWGEENLLVVRVHDSAAAGGIWKPIELHILK